MIHTLRLEQVTRITTLSFLRASTPTDFDSDFLFASGHLPLLRRLHIKGLQFTPDPSILSSLIENQNQHYSSCGFFFIVVLRRYIHASPPPPTNATATATYTQGDVVGVDAGVCENPPGISKSRPTLSPLTEYVASVDDLPNWLPPNLNIEVPLLLFMNVATAAWSTPVAAALSVTSVTELLSPAPVTPLGIVLPATIDELTGIR